MSAVRLSPATLPARASSKVLRLAAWLVASASDRKAGPWLVIGFAVVHATLWTLILINLKAANPKYQPGPLLLRGKLSNGKVESASQGKMYVSMVELPNGKVLETGGGLIDREDPVYEASMVDPAKLGNSKSEAAYTPMATDPVPRTYHSQSLVIVTSQAGRIRSRERRFPWPATIFVIRVTSRWAWWDRSSRGTSPS